MVLRKIYISAASSEVDRVQAALAKLEQLEGVDTTATRAWVAHVLDSHGKLSDADGFAVAMEDLESVEQSHWLWFMRPQLGRTSMGAWVELGCALGKDLSTVCSGARHESDIFSLCAEHIFDTDDEVLTFFAHLVELDIGQSGYTAHGDDM